MIDREELERLHEAATNGPWQRHGSHFYGDGAPVEAELLGQVVSPWGRCLHDLSLILYLRNTVPDILGLLTERDTLAAENAALTEKVERLEGALSNVEGYSSDTLTGRADGSADQKWYRDGFRVILKIVRAALKGEEG